MDLLEKDLFQFGVPLLKSFQVDENGDVIVEGIASVPKKDFQGEDLDPRGFVLGYFEKSGWIKWEHKGANNGPAAPNQFIGEPMEAKITPEGEFYLKARLYKDSPFTAQIRDQLELLEKSQSSRRMGFSIEGQAVQRDPANPLKVLKAIIRNVVLTMNPVNDGTWVTLCKSLAGGALEMHLDQDFSIEKALDTVGAAALMPQSLEGAKPNDEEDDETVKALTAFRSYVKKLLNTSLSKSLLDTDAYGIVQGAYDHAVDGGLAHAEALDFAKYVHQNRSILKSVPALVGQGGAGMSKLAKILGESMEELEKSLNTATQEDEEAELDALIKSLEGSENADEKEDEGGQEDEDEDEDEGGKEDENEEEEKKGEGMEKPLGVDLQKSMSDESIQTLDVSEFLGDLVKSVNTQMGEFAADQVELGKGLAVIARAMQAQNDLIKSLQTQVEEIGATPRGRRSVVKPNEVQTAQRQGGLPAASSDELNKSQVMTLLRQGWTNGQIPVHKITQFEMDFPLDLQTAQTIGLDPAKNPRWVQTQ